jgi:ABC-type nitrate/sulfonate/bicarbonate transport system substrate-binding protein
LLRPKGDEMTDTLWYTRCPGPSAAAIAINLGWLEREFSADGIAVKSLAASGDRAVHLSHYRHTQPNSFRFGGYVPPLLAKADGGDLKVIGLAWADRLAGVFALPGGPIKNAADLRQRHDSLLRHGLIRQPIDFADFVDPGPLERARRRRKVAV